MEKKLADKLRESVKPKEKGQILDGITININIPSQGMSPLTTMLTKKMLSDMKGKQDFIKVEGVTPSVS